MSTGSTGCSSPIIDPTNMLTNSLDIRNNNYTYVSYSSYSLGTIVSNTQYNGYIYLNANFSDDTTDNTKISYWIYSTVETGTAGSQMSGSNNLVVSDLWYNTNISKWQFHWWYVATTSIIPAETTLKFVILFRTTSIFPILDTTIPASISTMTTMPTGLETGFSPKPILNNAYIGYNDIVYYLPIVAIEFKTITLTSPAKYYFDTINIPDYTTSKYTVLSSLETSVPSNLNTRDISQIIIYNKKTNSFDFYFYSSTPTSGSVDLNVKFVIFYNSAV